MYESIFSSISSDRSSPTGLSKSYVSTLVLLTSSGQPWETEIFRTTKLTKKINAELGCLGPVKDLTGTRQNNLQRTEKNG